MVSTAGWSPIFRYAALALALSGRGVDGRLAAPPQGQVHADSDATELDRSNSTGLPLLHFAGFSNHGVDFPGANAKNGTPWFRLKDTDDRGEAGHSHFGGLEATGDFDYDVLEAHNAVRSFAGIAPLAWSQPLAQLAASRVRKLAEDGCYIRHTPPNERMQQAGFYYIGENLYKVINMVPTGVDIVDAWYAEIADYTYGRVGKDCATEKCSGRTSPPCAVGHFTQVMWADSKFVGCARMECPNQAKRTSVATCYYGEGGNIVGSAPFWPQHSEKLGFRKKVCPLGY